MTNHSQPRVPAIGKLLASDALAAPIARWGRQLVKPVLDELVAELKRDDRLPEWAADAGAYGLRITERLQRRHGGALRPVLNLSGTLLHTNLGRATLPASAVQAMVEAAGSVSVELDLATGRRGHRDAHAAALICALTGAEAATIVNNNAAAVLIALNTLAESREVLVSRGELIEIGGSFRIPDIMRRAGCELVEVGTTNRTHLRDFADAIEPTRTALMLKVHPSNYQIQGFTAEVDDGALAALGRRHDVPVLFDMGSGSLIDFARFGLPPEPTVQQAVANGADLITFSGDKLLGGPQAGIIVGRQALIDRINANPLKRTLRLDKVTLAALTAVLKIYGDPDRLDELPLVRQLNRTIPQLQQLGDYLQRALAVQLAPAFSAVVADSTVEVGSGSLPTASLPSVCLKVTARDGATQLRALTDALRTVEPVVIGHVANDALHLDLRTLDDARPLISALLSARERLTVATGSQL